MICLQYNTFTEKHIKKMSKIIFRTVMVVGDNPDELIKKYDLDSKVEPYV